MHSLTVQAPCGTLRGMELNGARFFRGVPYAVTERFEPPRPYRWEGVLDATGEEIDCWQYGSFRDESKDENPFYYEEFRSERAFHYDESPMTLNIITPPEPENCPVLVFIHGGGHETGTVGELPYGTSIEYARRGVMLVSVGYRLNVFHLFRSRNYGLQDQVFAIRWIHDNIAAFGGDPGRVTLMGQSAGAMSVMDLCCSRKLEGLVHGAIAMSGGGLVPKFVGPWTPEQSKDFWDAVLRRAGASTDEEAKKLPAKELWEAWYAESREHYSFHAVQPGIDGDIIPALPQKQQREGKLLDIPMILGVTGQDFMPYIIYEMAYSFAKKRIRRGGRPIYGYLFDRCPPGNRYKAYHAVDLWYAFGNLEQNWRPWEETDYRLCAEMIDYFAAFARTGDVNAPGLPRWEPLSRRNHGFRLLNGVSDGTASPLACRKRMAITTFRDKGPM